MFLAPRVVVAVLLLSSVPSAASAQDEPDPRENAEARGLYEAGRAAYEAERFAEAADYFQRAFDVSGLPDFLYNVGSAAERAGDDVRALEAYRAFLASDSESSARSRAEGRVRALEARQAALDAAAATRVQASDGATGDDAPGGGPNVLSWVVLGAGAGLLISGVVLVALGAADASTIENAVPEDDTQWSEVQGVFARGNRRLRWGAATLTLGGLAAVGGLLWALLAPGEESSASGARLDVGFGSLHLRGWF